MLRRTIQEKRLIPSVVAVATVFVVVFAGVTLGASTAHAQRASQLVNVPAPDVAEPRPPRDPQAPFGYGGGPRAPRPPDLIPRLGDIFDRIREFIDRLFGR